MIINRWSENRWNHAKSSELYDVHHSALHYTMLFISLVYTKLHVFTLQYRVLFALYFVPDYMLSYIDL